MKIETIIEEPRWRAVALAHNAGRAALALRRADLVEGWHEAALLACNDDRIADLNRCFRGKRGATNVLSWPSQKRRPKLCGEKDGEAALADMFLGDMAISFETIVHEARAEGVSMEFLATRLIIHSVLHLLGYDHQCREDARVMEALERRVLSLLPADKGDRSVAAI